MFSLHAYKAALSRDFSFVTVTRLRKKYSYRLEPQLYSFVSQKTDILQPHRNNERNAVFLSRVGLGAS